MDLPFAPRGENRKSLSISLPCAAVGVISGTSMDAVDVALLTTDGDSHIVRGPGLARPYTPAERQTVAAALPDAMAAPDSRHRTALITAAEQVVTEAHGDAIAAFLAAEGLTADLIGWHGQTIAHAPERRMTFQIGDADALARRFGVPVVSAMRQADVAAGGQGAPLVPAYHRALAASAGLAGPVLVINLGGVANVTFIDGDTLIAFDTGPASALIDDAMAEVGKAYDEGGSLAASGTVDEAALARLMDNDYFALAPPKSLDRDAFSPAPVAQLGFADRIATLTRFSAEALSAGVRQLPARPVTVIAAGGGTMNRTMIGFIEDALGVPVRSADAAGFSAEFMEAEAFAYLAVRSLRGLPLTFPGTTGVSAPLTGGATSFPAD
ncbi:anhydro-N-acetylmuramic acid kinase [Acuticoccus sp. MNP-M23]|uniref:anhydro-N-acetylmuramic acid kinase n=1 Tax=Acuticoccus sp. MNP-M23 TaxID=3072793 RepID=UPI002815B297|nr:anhydro-N-acetylmuramic acid kinase [Acuticoccus sp. MNP-M23]WMS42315.1 anhydro-N-acetylmuramic acid kinase [Acuticoccus sp. MNP-M23]